MERWTFLILADPAGEPIQIRVFLRAGEDEARWPVAQIRVDGSEVPVDAADQGLRGAGVEGARDLPGPRRYRGALERFEEPAPQRSGRLRLAGGVRLGVLVVRDQFAHHADQQPPSFLTRQS